MDNQSCLYSGRISFRPAEAARLDEIVVSGYQIPQNSTVIARVEIHLRDNRGLLPLPAMFPFLCVLSPKQNTQFTVPVGVDVLAGDRYLVSIDLVGYSDGWPDTAYAAFQRRGGDNPFLVQIQQVGPQHFSSGLVPESRDAVRSYVDSPMINQSGMIPIALKLTPNK